MGSGVQQIKISIGLCPVESTITVRGCIRWWDLKRNKWGFFIWFQESETRADMMVLLLAVVHCTPFWIYHSHISAAQGPICASHLRYIICGNQFQIQHVQETKNLADTCWHKKDSTLVQLSSFESLPKDTLLGHERQWSSPQVPELIYHDMVIPPWYPWFLESR